MTDLQRLFRQLVRNLAATDPARLHRALPLTDIRDTIVQLWLSHTFAHFRDCLL